VSDRKSYAQFCGLARSLDHVGDRWTLLVVRELLLGDRTFRELEEALAGVSPSLLAKRLAEMGDDGLVARNDAPQRSPNVRYALTEAGRALEPVIVGLIRWGTRWMLAGPGDDLVDPRWAPLALKALLEDGASVRGRVHLDVDGIAITVDALAGRRRVTPGHHGRANATVSASLPALLAVVADAVPLAASGASTTGDRSLATAMLAPPAQRGP